MNFAVKNLTAVSDIEVGWYAFADGKFSANPKAYRNLQGVVAWINADRDAPKGKKGLILMPEQVKRLWAETLCDTRIGDENNGKNNTHKLLTYGRNYKVLLPAVEWCVNYHKHGVLTGDGFMPAKQQLLRIVQNVKIVNEALEKIGGDKLSGYIWTSSEYNPCYAWVVKAENAQQYTNLKHYSQSAVRCVVAF